jgi:hypothetical protein
MENDAGEPATDGYTPGLGRNLIGATVSSGHTQAHELTPRLPMRLPGQANDPPVCAF